MRGGLTQSVFIRALLFELTLHLSRELGGGHGINGDTMETFPVDFWQASLKQHYPLALECESGGIPGTDAYPDTKFSPVHYKDARVNSASG